VPKSLNITKTEFEITGIFLLVLLLTILRFITKDKTPKDTETNNDSVFIPEDEPTTNYNNNGKEDNLVEVYKSYGNLVEINMITTLLKSEKIPFMISGETAGRLYAITINGLAAKRIYVHSENYDRAKEIITDALNYPHSSR
jgi:hypothetical protein